MFTGTPQPVANDRLAYIVSKLLNKNILRYTTILFGLLIVPQFLVRGVFGSIDMLITSIFLAVMMRNIDPVIGGMTKSVNTSNPAGAVPFILPIAFTVSFGFLADSFILVGALMGGYYIAVGILVVVLSARLAVMRILIPLARMLIDPNFEPSDFASPATAGPSEGLLMRSPLNDGEFQPFSGSGNVLNSQITAV
jgi:hypothetical protein